MNELGPQYRLEELQRRWQAQKSPTVALQLAEEYRNRRRIKEAAAVLAEGLEAHPDHPAAEVALARDLLDLGRARQAAAVLEGVVARDPMHLVANKLLVTAYTRSERLKEARDRLDLYALLNEGDTDIASLESRLAARAEEPFAMEEAVEAPLRLAEVSPPAQGASGGRRSAQIASTSDPFLDPWSEVAVAEAPASDVFGDLFARQTVSVEAGDGESGTELGDIFGTVTVEPGDETPTATLAQLHLEQGHVAEAEEIFAEVRAQDSVAAEAPVEPRRGSGLPASLTAAELLGDEGANLEATARKALLLRAYLARLKGEAN